MMAASKKGRRRTSKGRSKCRCHLLPRGRKRRKTRMDGADRVAAVMAAVAVTRRGSVVAIAAAPSRKLKG